MPPERTRILVVDDEPINIAVFRNILDEDSFEVMESSSGEEAINKAHLFKPDMMLLDIMMPKMDGYEVCRAIKADAGLSNIKTIMVSAKARVEDRVAGYQSGAVDYVTKPFEPEEILAKIHTIKELKTAKEFEDHRANLIRLISHEIRTPLNSLLGYASILNQSLSLNEHERAFLQKIMAAGNELLGLSSKFLTLEELEGDAKPAFKLFSIKKFIIEVKTKYRLVFQQASIELHIDDVDDIDDIMIKADEQWLAMVMGILLDNALKYAGKSSQVRVQTNISKNEVTWWVMDQGSGIPDHIKANLFREKSAGINLRIAYLICKAHGGNLSLVRSDSLGTTFKVTIKQ